VIYHRSCCSEYCRTKIIGHSLRRRPTLCSVLNNMTDIINESCRPRLFPDYYAWHFDLLDGLFSDASGLPYANIESSPF